MHIPYEPLFFDFRRIDCIRLYNTRFRSVLRYTANCDVIRQFAFTGHIPAQVKKRHEAIFSVLSGFCADMGKYPILALKRLYGQIMALYGKLCRFGICPIVSEYPFQPVQYRQGIPMKYYVNLPTCPLEYYVNRSDPQENSWAWSICSDWSGSGRVSADGFGTL